ncbi:MAG: hypothetical protein ACRDJX_11880 [Solirubrobacteraceae bacterium]
MFADPQSNRFDLIRFLDHLDSEIPIIEGQQIVAVSDNLSATATHCRMRASRGYGMRWRRTISGIQIFGRRMESTYAVVTR